MYTAGFFTIGFSALYQYSYGLHVSVDDNTVDGTGLLSVECLSTETVLMSKNKQINDLLVTKPPTEHF